jgi:mannose-6-phosphate isomerase-like protein (cupin superfamily)
MISSITEFGGKLVRSNEQHDLHDHDYLQNLTLSKTVLNGGKSTQGHKHDGVDEVYIFISGQGSIEIDNKSFRIQPGSIAQIKGGEFHRVNNLTKEKLEFISIFQRYER